jgi:hypothetical protein
VRGGAVAAAVLGIAALPAVGYSAGHTKRGDGWLTGTIVKYSGSVEREPPTTVGGWVHVEAVGGKLVVLKNVSVGGFKIKLPEGEYKVFATVRPTQERFACVRWVKMDPRRVTTVTLAIGCEFE